MSQTVVCALLDPTEPLGEAVLGETVLLGRQTTDALAFAGRPASHVVVVAQRRDDAAARRHAAILSDLGHTVAVRVLPHGPAATLLLALNASRLGAEPGVTVGWLDAAARRTWSGAWVPGVAHLEDPPPSMLQHAASLVPGGDGFVVTLAGAPIRPVVRVGAVPDPLDTGSRPVLHVTSGKFCSRGRADLLRAASAVELDELPFAAGLAGARFGHPRAVEGVALPAHPLSLVPAAPAETCTVCGAGLVETVCSYCRVRPVPHEALVPGGVL